MLSPCTAEAAADRPPGTVLEAAPFAAAGSTPAPSIGAAPSRRTSNAERAPRRTRGGDAERAGAPAAGAQHHVRGDAARGNSTVRAPAGGNVAPAAAGTVGADMIQVRVLGLCDMLRDELGVRSSFLMMMILPPRTSRINRPAKRASASTGAGAAALRGEVASVVSVEIGLAAVGFFRGESGGRCAAVITSVVAVVETGSLEKPGGAGGRTAVHDSGRNNGDWLKLGTIGKSYNI